MGSEVMTPDDLLDSVNPADHQTRDHSNDGADGGEPQPDLSEGQVNGVPIAGKGAEEAGKEGAEAASASKAAAKAAAKADK